MKPVKFKGSKEIAIKLCKLDTGKQQASIANMTEILGKLSELYVSHPEVAKILTKTGKRRLKRRG